MDRENLEKEPTTMPNEGFWFSFFLLNDTRYIFD